MLRAKLCCILMPRSSSAPTSLPTKTTSMPLSKPGFLEQRGRGVPAHVALPIKPCTRGSARLPKPHRKDDLVAWPGFELTQGEGHGSLDQNP